VLCNKHNPKYFSTTDELAEEVKNAIIPTYRAGVKSLVIENESLRTKIQALELENKRNIENSISKGTFPQGILGGLSQPKGLLGAVNENIENQNRNNGGLGLLGPYKSLFK
jgi:hypothetical protein